MKLRLRCRRRRFNLAIWLRKIDANTENKPRVLSLEYVMGAKISIGKVYRDHTEARVATPLGTQFVRVPGYHCEDTGPLISQALSQAWSNFCCAG